MKTATSPSRGVFKLRTNSLGQLMCPSPHLANYRDYELLHSPLATRIALWDYNKINCIAGMRPEQIWII